VRRNESLYVLINLNHLQATGEIQKAKDLISNIPVKKRFKPRVNNAGTRAILQIKPSYDISKFKNFIDHEAVLGWGNIKEMRGFVLERRESWELDIILSKYRI
jgi:hypothetical protein